ncbi:hypothetical protein GCM10009557_76300 [Virgisporangium ochraceum]|uniref:Uncharacterized protein n=1 Tax=Virgisporangium ochraceum TaxID=65505 RepID=A0A8J3ZUB0_9ACTN|nr:hypothetical protein Voc01_055110 [Virgisporangium ochraceum]
MSERFVSRATRASRKFRSRRDPIVAGAGSILCPGGAICLEHLGCAQRTWLVVSGPARGQMWDDPRADCLDLRPVVGPGGSTSVNFAAWYLRWLDDAEHAAG